MLERIAPGLTGGTILMHDGLGPGALRDGCRETVRLVEAIGALTECREPALA